MKPPFELPLRIDVGIDGDLTDNVYIKDAVGNIIARCLTLNHAKHFILAINSFEPLVKASKDHKTTLYRLWERGAIIESETASMDRVNALLEAINKETKQ